MPARYKKLFTLFIATAFIAGILPVNLEAQTSKTYTALEPLPCIEVPGDNITCPQGGQQKEFDFKSYVQYAFNLIIAAAAAAAVFMIVFGGLQYMTTDSWTGKKDGLAKVKGALLGLLLVLTSYIILRTIDPRFVTIPNTLVKPLNLKSIAFNPNDTNGLLTEFMRQLEEDKIKYNTDIAAFKTRAENARVDLNRLKTVDGELASKLGLTNPTEAELSQKCLSAPTPDVVALCSERSRLLERKTETQRILDLNIAMGKMRQTVQQCGIMSGVSCFRNIGYKADIDAIYSEYSPKVGAEYVSLLSAYRDYSKAWFNTNYLIAQNSTNYFNWVKQQTVIKAEVSKMGQAAAGIETYSANNRDVLSQVEVVFIKERQQELEKKLADILKDLNKDAVMGAPVG